MTLKANWFQTNVSPLVDARDERRLLRALRPTGGVVQPGDLAVTAVGAGTTLNVSVAACSQGGGAIIPGLDINQGAYFAYNDAALQVPVAVADPTNPRIDTVILRIYDDEVVPGTGFAVAVEMVRGAPNANPIAPVLPRDCLPLADVRVNANATGIGAGNITDRRANIDGRSPRGIIASGTAGQPAANAVMNLSTVVGGPAAWLAANTVTLPVGAGGLYLIQLAFNFRSSAIVGIRAEVSNAAGVAYNPPMVLSISTNPSTWDPVVHHAAWIRQCPDGDTFRVYNRGNAEVAPDYHQVGRFSLLRVGDALATS